MELSPSTMLWVILSGCIAAGRATAGFVFSGFRGYTGFRIQGCKFNLSPRPCVAGPRTLRIRIQRPAVHRGSETICQPCRLRRQLQQGHTRCAQEQPSKVGSPRQFFCQKAGPQDSAILGILVGSLNPLNLSETLWRLPPSCSPSAWA